MTVNQRSGVGASLVLALLTLSGLLWAACGGLDVSQPLTFENDSGATVTVRVDDRLRLLIAPGETKSFNTPNNQGSRHILVVDETAMTRLDRTYSWDELKALGFHIVVH